MEHGKGVEQHVVGPKTPCPVQGQGIGGQILVGEHRPLGPPGGSAGVDDRGQIVRLGRHVVKLVGLFGGDRGERPVAPHVGGKQLRPSHGPRPGRVADDDARTGITDEIGKLGVGIGRVQGQEHGPRPDTGEVEQQCLRGLFDLHGHTVTATDPDCGQSVGQPGRSPICLSIGHGLLPGNLE